MKILSAIWGWFSGSTIGKYLIEGIILVGSAGALYAKVRLDGERAQQGKDAEATLKDVQTVRKVEAEVAQKPASDVQTELANKWNRP